MKRSIPLILVLLSLCHEVSAQKPSLDPMKVTLVESVAFNEAELGSVLDYIAEKSTEAVGAPVNIITIGDSTRVIPVTIELRAVPLSTLLRYACENSGCEFEIQSDQTILVGPEAALAAAKASWNRAPVVTGKATIAEQLARETLDSLDLVEADLESALEFLGAKGANFILLEKTDPELGSTPVTLKLDSVSYATAVRYLDAVAGAGVGFRVDRFAVVFGAPADVVARPKPAVALTDPVMAHMMRKRLPEVVIDGASLTEALELVRFHGADFGGGINLLDQTGGVEETISLSMKNMPLSEALRYICEQTGTTFTIDGRTVTIRRLPPPPVTKE